MIVETISVTQRKNLGNYEHVEVSATARVEENESYQEAIFRLKEGILFALASRDIPAPEVTSQDEKEVVTEEPKKERKPRSKKEETPKEEPVKEEPVKEEKFKGVHYDRQVDTHKNALSIHLSNNFPGWKTAKAKELIISFTSGLQGMPFQDENGEIIDSFKEHLNGFFGA